MLSRIVSFCKHAKTRDPENMLVGVRVVQEDAKQDFDSLALSLIPPLPPIPQSYFICCFLSFPLHAPSSAKLSALRRSIS
jgi:hypothetical protein